MFKIRTWNLDPYSFMYSGFVSHTRLCTQISELAQYQWLIQYEYILLTTQRTTDNQWRHKSKISEKLGQCGRQNMLRPYLKIWEWEWIFVQRRPFPLWASVVRGWKHPSHWHSDRFAYESALMRKLDVFNYSAANLQMVPYWIFLYNKCISFTGVKLLLILKFTWTCQGMGDGASLPPTILLLKLIVLFIHAGIFAHLCLESISE